MAARHAGSSSFRGGPGSSPALTPQMMHSSLPFSKTHTWASWLVPTIAPAVTAARRRGGAASAPARWIDNGAAAASGFSIRMLRVF